MIYLFRERSLILSKVPTAIWNGDSGVRGVSLGVGGGESSSSVGSVLRRDSSCFHAASRAFMKTTITQYYTHRKQKDKPFKKSVNAVIHI